MILSENLRDIVNQIKNQLVISDSYTEKRLLRVVEDHPAFVYSEDSFDVVLLPTDHSLLDENERLDGLIVSVKDKELSSDMNQRYLKVKTQSEKRELFVPFIADLVSRELDDPLEALNETLKEWREFWNGKRVRLSKIEQIGLIGELLVLKELLQHSSHHIVQHWVGPLDKLHDFEGVQLDIEVKTTTKTPDSVHISKVSQVAPMDGPKDLQLVVVGLEQGDEFSLVELIDFLRVSLIELRSLFEKTLRKAGFRDSDRHHYTQKYSLSFLKSHEITENSPVIDPKKLGELPKTVENIRYTLLTHALETKMLDTDDWRRLGLQILGGF